MNKIPNSRSINIIYINNFFNRFISKDNVLYKIDLKLIAKPYISPKIISKFLPIDLYYKIIPDTVIAKNCFPQGILNSIIDSNKSKYENLNIKQVVFI